MAKSLDDATAEIERIADAIMNAEYLLVCGGPTFDDAPSNPFDSEFCSSALISKPNKFMGFWGQHYNDYLDKIPHEGYNVIAKLRDKLFCSEDIRRRNKKTKGDVGEEDQFVRFMVYTGHVGNSYQKSGVPEQEMMEVCGNITQWQCGESPICSARLFGVERGFKFFIDPLTHDALPIKYVPPKPPAVVRPYRQTLVDSDDEEEAFRKQIASGGDGGGLLAMAKGASAEDKARRAQRLRNHCRAIHLTQQVQVLDRRFPDLFTGHVETVGGALETYTFDGAAASNRGGGPSVSALAEAQRRHEEQQQQQQNGADAAGGGGGGNDAKKGGPKKDQPPPPPPKPCAAPNRVSHLLAHVNAIDRKMYASTHFGACSPVDAERWRADRDAYFAARGKGPMAPESHSVSSRREKILKYNISLVITTAPPAPPLDGSAASDASPHPSSSPGGKLNATGGDGDGDDALSVASGLRPTVLPAALRERLLRPYPSPAASNKKLNNGGSGTGANANVNAEAVGDSGEEAAIDALVSTEMAGWTQASNGWYYFSNVPLSRTQQEPLHNSYSDFVQIDFPQPVAPSLSSYGAGGVGGFAPVSSAEGLLPLRGMVSIVCEAVMLAEGEHVPPAYAKAMAAAAAGPHSSSSASAAAGGLPPNPYVYTNNVWQMVGTIDTSAAAVARGLPELPKGSAAAAAAQANPSSHRGGGAHGGRGEGAMFEYVLEGRRGHVLHIGALRSDPRRIVYLRLEVPHQDWPAAPGGVPSRLVRPMRDSSGAGASSAAYGGDDSFSGSPTAASPYGSGSGAGFGSSVRGGGCGGGGGSSDDQLVPTLNHILCLGCRELARPYILMTRTGPGGRKDDGFASSVMAQRTRAFKAWEKSIVDALKQDQNKSIVMIEVGADRKMDPSRAYSEKTYKLLKTAKCTFVRLCPFNLETKAKTGPSGDSANRIAIVCSPIAGLQAIERAVNERIKKITK